MNHMIKNRLQKSNKIKSLRKMDKLTFKSKLSQKGINEISEIINREVTKKLNLT